MSIVLYFILAISLLVVIHEFGHFWVARRCGIKVIRFSVGFGKPLFSFTDKHGTEFSLAPIPLGGYVKMLDEREAPVAEHEKHLAFNQKPAWQRIAVAVAGPVANFIFAIVAYWCLFIAGTQGLKPVVGSVVPESLAAQYGVQADEQILSIDGKETDSMQKVMWQLIRHLGSTDQIKLELQNIETKNIRQLDIPVVEWLADAEAPNPFAELGLKTRQLKFDIYLGEIVEGGRGEQAGLKSGDHIIAVDGQKVAGWQDWVAYIQAHAEQPVVFTLMREDQQMQIEVVPEAKEKKDGSIKGYVGVGPDISKIPPIPKDWLINSQLDPLWAVPKAIEKTWQVTEFTLVSLWKMIKGELSVKNLSGPIQIAKVADDSARSGLLAFISFLALLSVSLGVLNLLPIPVLDGGHIVFYTIELIRGRPLADNTQLLAVKIGMALLLSVMMIAFYNDLSRL